jgi:hypothetical protein
MPAMAYMGGRTEAIGCRLDFICVAARLKFGLGVSMGSLGPIEKESFGGEWGFLSWDISWMEGWRYVNEWNQIFPRELLSEAEHCCNSCRFGNCSSLHLSIAQKEFWRHSNSW